MSIEAVSDLGYNVGPAYIVGGTQVWSVTGFGVSLYLRDDEIGAFIDPAAHAERATQFRDGPPEPTLTASGPTALEVVTALDPKTATVADVIDVLKEFL